MGVIGRKLRSLDGGLVAFMCPGCRQYHAIRVAGEGRPRWSYNGDPDAPSFSPSVLVRGVVPITDAEAEAVLNGQPADPKPARCHSFVTQGRIRFLDDCHHELAGQTVDLPDIATENDTSE